MVTVGDLARFQVVDKVEPFDTTLRQTIVLTRIQLSIKRWSWQMGNSKNSRFSKQVIVG